MIDITLRKWEDGDKQALAVLCGQIDRQYLSERIPDPYTAEDAAEYLKMVKEKEAKCALYRAIICHEKIIGSISLEQKSDVYRIDAEIGYFLHNDYHNQGIMSEAVKQICALGFKELKIERISALVYEENVASLKVLKKNAFKQEGIMLKAALKNGKLHNVYLLAKLQEKTSDQKAQRY